MKNGRYNLTLAFGSGFEGDPRQLNWVIGDYFEALMLKLLPRSAKQEDKSVVGTQRGQANPDIVYNDGNRDVLFEVKAVSCRGPWMLSVRQYEDYFKFMDGEFPYFKPIIYYCLFRYGAGRNHTLEGANTVDSIIDRLSQCKKELFILPFNYIGDQMKKEHFKYGRSDYVRLRVTDLRALPLKTVKTGSYRLFKRHVAPFEFHYDGRVLLCRFLK